MNTSISHAKIIETPKGYLVYGFNKKNFKVDAYNKDLVLINSITSHVPVSRFYLTATTIGKDYYFLSKAFSLLVDENGNQKEVKTWDKSLYSKYIQSMGKEGLNTYTPINLPYGDYLDGSHIYFEDKYLQVISEDLSKYSIFARYKPKPKIRLFESIESDNFTTYKLEWEFSLDFEIINSVQWFNFGKDNLYLYIAGDGNKRMLYKVDITTKKVLFVHDLNPNQSTINDLSNLTLDSQGNVIVVGVNSIKVSTKDIGYISNGWFISKINQRGKTLTRKVYPFEKHILLSYDKKTKNTKGEIEKEGEIRYKYINFHHVDIVGNKIVLTGENFRITTTKYEKYFVDESYGFSNFELSEGLEIIDTKFKPQREINKNKVGSYSVISTEKRLNFIDHLVLSPNIQNLLYFRIKQKRIKKENYFYDDSNVLLITTGKDEEGHTLYYKTKLIGDDDKKVIKQKKEYWSPIRYFLQSPNEAIEFYSNRKGYSLNRVRI